MRIQWSSDHHTLHKTTPTAHILSNMSTFYFKDHDLGTVDLVIKGGDLMDNLVDSNNPELFKVKEWGQNFLNKCKDANTAVLLLEGTWSHEWGQPKHWETVAPLGMDFRYVDKLSIQHYPQLKGLTVMCVPDNMGGMTPDEVWELALSVLAEHKLKQVDVIAFHGTWAHQLPGHSLDKKHDPVRWESICKYLILSGHIHTPSIEGKIHSSGSFDRIGHGEEHPKGGFIVDLDQEKETYNVTFWENKKALPYVTLTVKETITPEQLVLDLRQFIKDKKLPYKGQVRVKGGPSDVVNPILAVFEKEYPHLGFKAKNLKSDNELMDEDLFKKDPYDGVSITRENIKETLWPEVSDEFTKLGISREEAEAILEGIIK